MYTYGYRSGRWDTSLLSPKLLSITKEKEEMWLTTLVGAQTVEIPNPCLDLVPKYFGMNTFCQ